MRKINALALLLLGCGLSFSASARLYKWVDEKGATHYGEVVPPEYAQKNRSELSSAGRVLSTQEAVTPEQLKAKEDALKKQRTDEESAQNQKRQDKALLNTFSSVAEIEASKARSLQQVEGKITSTAMQIKITQNKLAGLQSEARTATAAGKHIPIAVRDEIKETQTRLTKQQADLATYRAEKQSVETRFETDKARYRYLTEGGGAQKL